MRIIAGIIILWMLWASLSTGGLYKLKQINPEYTQQNKSLAYLVTTLNESLTSNFWGSYHVEVCSSYMPNWKKAETCVSNRMVCEILYAPIKKDSPRPHRDIYSKSFQKCWSEKRPFLGINEWLHTSRSLWRMAIFSGFVWINGGFDHSGEKYEKWDKNNKWWVQPMSEWMEKGQ